MSKIQCRICNNIFDRNSLASHLRTHKIKFKDYVDQNIDQFPHHQTKPCLICGKQTKNDKVCSKKCSYKYFSKYHSGENSKMKGVKKSEKHRKHLSEWAKERLKDETNHPMYDKHHSEEAKRKISKKRLENQKLGKYEFLKGDTNPACRPEVRKKMSETHLKRGTNKGKNNPMYGKTHSPEAIKKIFSHRKMNKLEKLVAKTLDDAGYEYTFQFFIHDGDICKLYDFKIKGKPIIIEVDGNFWHGHPDNIKGNYVWKEYKDVQKNDKLKEQMAKNKGYSIHRYWGSEIKKNPDIILKKLI